MSRVSAPKVWKRPYNHIYNYNYDYGTSLYSEEIANIDMRYNGAFIGRSSVWSRRPEFVSQNSWDSLSSSMSGRSSSSSRRSDTDSPKPGLRHSESFTTSGRPMTAPSDSALRKSRSITGRKPRPESTIGIPFTFRWEPLASSESRRKNKDDNKSDDKSNEDKERWYRNSLRSVAYNLYPTSLLKIR
ncbi:uncharacterized protein LOC128955476 [Oppia nitens]|uniref:uncharacterized protein LOC128955476 n=1 Tax=Oppia nitens TaxID=1686743 RepID=UPI0023DC0A8D|nr:uncharacterized protein LOC128955476 [Oppia nitens]